MKQHILRLVKFLFSAALIAYLFVYRIDLKEVLHAIANFNPYWLLAAASLHITGLLLSAIRWKILLKALGIDQTIGRLFSYYLVGFFFNMFLPTQVGGDVVRIVDTSADHGSAARPLAAVVVERVTGLITLMLIASIVLIVQWDIGFDIYGRFPGLQAGIWFFIGLMAAGVLLFHPRVEKILGRLAEKWARTAVIHKIWLKFLSIFKAFQAFGGGLRYLAGALLVGAVLQVNFIFHFFLIAKALSIPVNPSFFFVMIPLRSVALTIPFFINGIGLREFFDTTVFNLIGVRQSQAVAFAELQWMVQIFFALIGGLIYVFRRKRASAVQANPA